MVDLDTYLLYVILDDYCKTLPPEQHPGPAGALSCSEVIGIFSRWRQV